MNSSNLEYRPNTTVGYLFVAIFGVTAAVLVWVGFAVGPEDREAMSGFTRILFTVVPVSFFSFLFAAVFVFFGYRIARRTIREQATLLICDASLTLPDGVVVAWEDIATVQTTEDSHLAISLKKVHQEEAAEPPAKPPRRSWLNRQLDPDAIVMSSFELGTDPLEVAEEIERRMAACQAEHPAAESDDGDSHQGDRDSHQNDGSRKGECQTDEDKSQASPTSE